MKKLLCVPCANGLRAEGKTVKMMPGKTAKITCEGCGRRRFGVAYDVASEPSRTARMDRSEDERRPGTRSETSPSRREAVRREQAKREDVAESKKKG